jgi:hypothetical protein
MALNFGLLGDAGAPAMGYLQGQQDVARNQLAQQQIETGRMTQDKMRMEMDAMKRRQAGLDQFMQKAKELGVDGDPEQLARTFYEHAISTGDMQQVQAAQMAVQAAKERKEYMASQPGAGGAVATPVPMTNNLGTALPPAGAPPMPFSAGAAPAAAPPQGNALAGNRLSQIENRLVELRQFPNAGAQERADLIKERDRLMTPHVVGKNLISGSGAPLYTAPVEPTAPKLHVVGRNLVDETGKVVFKAQPEPGTGIPKAPPGYRVTATGDLEAIPGGPAAGKPLTEAQTIKLRTDVGKDYKNASTALSQIDDLLASATSVKTAPGLSAATGFTGLLPSFSEGAAAQAETRLANLRGKVTALGKATAAMGGAIGSIANQEWKILADQIAVLNEVKGKGPLLEQIALLEEQAKGASERIRDAYEKTRADDFERFPQFRDLPAPKAPGGAAPAGVGGFKYLGKENK